RTNQCCPPAFMATFHSSPSIKKWAIVGEGGQATGREDAEAFFDCDTQQSFLQLPRCPKMSHREQSLVRYAFIINITTI
ncbi:Hypothetical predicted protein, partial [Podarcis lilfordi]